MITEQPSLFPDVLFPTLPRNISSTFSDNMRLPVHRWFRYSAGFSAEWVNSVIAEQSKKKPLRVLDPFAGSGTTLLCAEDAGLEAIGVEAHPFVVRVARAKLFRHSDVTRFEKKSQEVTANAQDRVPRIGKYSELIRRCYSDEALAQLDQLQQSIEMLHDDTPAAQLAWLNLVGILRKTAQVGTAQCQYILPNKTKIRSTLPFKAFNDLSRQMESDMINSPSIVGLPAILVQGDARTCETVPDDFANLVITSPPYPNNYDYADATRLEMTFLGEIDGWGGLQKAVRQYLVRSCSQHVPERALNLSAVLSDPALAIISEEIAAVCDNLSHIRKTKGGRKNYHLMIAAYFLDLANVWLSLRRVCSSPSRVCFVIGDSAPYGVYVPVVEWLGKLALSAGFESYSFERTRDRNVKWKNRKHNVPLCEGRLWVDG